MMLAAAAVALLSGTTVASAQVYDDPPGWAFQRRGIIDSSGQNPNRYYGGYGGYGYGAYEGYAYAPGYRSYRYRAEPPGGRFQDRGIDEDLGRNPLRWRR
jgi:hypothetical protein